jgi:hypothetical protein
LGRSYIEWKPFKHPTLGDIEIGGWDQFATRMPPAELFIEEGFRNAMFTLKHAESFAELEFVSVEAKLLQPGVVRLRIAVKNRGVMPTDSAMAVQRNEDDPVRVGLGLKGGVVISAGLADETFTRVTLQKGLRKNYLEIPRISSEEIQYAEMIVRPGLGPRLHLHASHPRAVGASIEIDVK